MISERATATKETMAATMGKNQTWSLMSCHGEIKVFETQRTITNFQTSRTGEGRVHFHGDGVDVLAGGINHCHVDTVWSFEPASGDGRCGTLLYYEICNP